MTIVKFGKYRGRNIEGVSDSYLAWIIDVKQKELTEFQNEFARRHPAAQPIIQPVVSEEPENTESGLFRVFTDEALKRLVSQLADRCVTRVVVPFVDELDESRTYKKQEIMNRLYMKSSTFLTALRMECTTRPEMQG